MADEQLRADLPSGFDDSDPYENVDTTEYPEWWQANIRLFREHGLRPYRPARFVDGTVVPAVLKRLRSELDVDITVRTDAPNPDNEWRVLVDGTVATTIECQRTTEGYTCYQMTSEEFEWEIKNTISK
jgi:hypothetical protein